MELIPFFVVCLSFLFALPVSADTMSSDSYSIEKSSTNDELPTPTTVPGKPTELPGQEDLSSMNESSFTAHIDTTSLSFDTLYPTDPVLRTVNVRLTPGRETNLTVFQQEDHSLTSGEGQLIPDTTCDAGLCTPYTSAVWTNILTYGFGFRCEAGTTSCDVKSDHENYFKNSNEQRHEFPASFFETSNEKPQLLSLTYKLNTGSTQPSGIYQNTIRYIIVPTY